MRSPGRAALLVPLLAVAVSCVHADGEVKLPESRAFVATSEAWLGQQLAPVLEERAGQTGVYKLASGLDAFAARALMIEAAERAIDAQYYIFHDDVTGRFLLSRLLAAADRGVRVRLLIDDLGSPGLDPLLAAVAAHENFEVGLFNPLARGPLPGLVRFLDLLAHPIRLNHRMHNKMLAVDGSLAVVGGRNVGDEYFDASPHVNFADMDLVAAGAVLAELGESFDMYWNSEFVAPVRAWKRNRVGSDATERLREEFRAHEEAQADSRYAERLRESQIVKEVTEGTLSLVWGTAHAFWDLPRKVVAEGDEIAETLLARDLRPVFEGAQRELAIVSPYFVPQKAGTAFLRGIAERGVRVRILTNSLAATDVPAVHSGYARYRRDLLEAGIELYELKQTGQAFQEAEREGLFGSSSASLHAKTYAIDHDRVFVGSLNLDPRSVALNTELGILVESEELSADFLSVFERSIVPELAWRVALEDGRLVWTGTDDGAPERYTKDPKTSVWQRFKVGLLRILPIEGQI